MVVFKLTESIIVESTDYTVDSVAVLTDPFITNVVLVGLKL